MSQEYVTRRRVSLSWWLLATSSIFPKVRRSGAPQEWRCGAGDACCLAPPRYPFWLPRLTLEMAGQKRKDQWVLPARPAQRRSGRVPPLHLELAYWIPWSSLAGQAAPYSGLVAERQMATR